MRLFRLTLIALLLPCAAAEAATLSATYPSGTSFPPRFAIAMGAGISTLTIDAQPGDGSRFRVAESGDNLVLGSQQPGPGGVPPCSQVGATISCTPGTSFTAAVEVANSGGSNVAGIRDVVIVAGAAHGDPPASWPPNVGVSVTTSGLMEFFDGQLGGTFAGSDIAVGDAATPADIYHPGAGGCFLNCDLKRGADRLEGGAGGDRVSGGEGNDVLLGGAGDDQLDGGPGDDLIAPGANRDSSTGGDGADTLSYDDPARPAGLTATFAAGAAGTLGELPYDKTASPIGTQDGVDSHDGSFERFVGTPLADRLTGGDAGEGIDGAGGDDVLRGGRGADVLAGGPGTDTVDYADRAAGEPVTARLPGGSGAGTAALDGVGDTLSDIETALGGAGDDGLTGGAGPETLVGGAGADRLDAGGGADTLRGGEGIDTFLAGDGDDTIFALDSLREIIECGPGTESVERDEIDDPRDCPTPPATLSPPATTPQPPAPPTSPPLPSAPALPRIVVIPTLGTTVVRDGRTRVRFLRIARLRRGDSVATACRGRGCRRSATRKATTMMRSGTLSLTAALKGMVVSPRATLVVTVRRKGAQTRVITYTFVRGSPRAGRPGARRPRTKQP